MMQADGRLIPVHQLTELMGVDGKQGKKGSERTLLRFDIC